MDFHKAAWIRQGNARYSRKRYYRSPIVLAAGGDTWLHSKQMRLIIRERVFPTIDIMALAF
jgi:hypothetical protein